MNVLGCDIGNGYGYVSLLLDPQEDPRPLFPGSYGLTAFGMPATAYVTPPDGENIEVFQGKAAEIKYKSRPEQFVRAVKTRLKEGSVTVPNVERPVEVSRVYSAIVRDLVALAEEELANMAIDPVFDLVFTFPAAFADDAVLLETMQKSIESIVMNGNPLRVLGRLPEPAAVAIDYLHYMKHLAPEEIRIAENRFTVLVYDLGHGTFDAAVVTAQSEGTPYTLHSKAGLPEVGGRNFDLVLYQEILSQLQEQYGFIPQNARRREEIRQEAVKAKIALTDHESYTASIVNEEGDYWNIEITRSRFEELSQHLLLQTMELVQEVLDEAAASGIAIDAVVLSGGASKMPMVRKTLEALVEGSYPIVLYRPSEAVSFGAARFAHGIPAPLPVPDPAPDPLFSPARQLPVPGPEMTRQTNRVMEQLTDCCYGIWFPAEGRLEGEIRFLIPCGTKRPAVSEPVTFVSASSRVVVKLYRSKEKNKKALSAAPDACESLLWIPFDVSPGAVCRLTVTVLENYGIEVELSSDRGDYDRKSTSDKVEKLI